MNESEDALLLARFAGQGCEASFEALVRRYIHLVHSSALRSVGNAHLAEEVTQAVFITLARKAGSLAPGTVISGWLYRTARLTGANCLRAELRRSRREREAFLLTPADAAPADPVWWEVAPVLDQAMDRLAPADRDAVVLRYFENKTLHEVGRALGVEERAAQKRVSRALERLRRLLARRGVRSTGVLIAGALAAHSVQAAPAGLAPTTSAAALKGSVAAASTLTLWEGALHVMKWIQSTAAVGLAAGALVAVGAATAMTLHAREQGETAPASGLQAKLTAERAEAGAGVGRRAPAERAESGRTPEQAHQDKLDAERAALAGGSGDAAAAERAEAAAKARQR